MLTQRAPRAVWHGERDPSADAAASVGQGLAQVLSATGAIPKPHRACHALRCVPACPLLRMHII